MGSIYDNLDKAMDEYDYRLITLLRQNGRRSISDLAHEIGLSRATVRARMEKLEQSGRHRRYTVILRRCFQRAGARDHADRGGGPHGGACRCGSRRLSGSHRASQYQWQMDFIAEIAANSLTEFDAILHRNPSHPRHRLLGNQHPALDAEKHQRAALTDCGKVSDPQSAESRNSLDKSHFHEAAIACP